jgi:putative nucleotidyltransferase with HDIG domain
VALQERSNSVIGKGARPGLVERLRGRELLAFAAAGSVLLSLLLTLDLVSPGPRGLGRSLQAGDIADRSYKAPQDLTLVDHAATEDHRRAALEQAPVVYDYDERWGQSLRERIDAAFAQARAASPAASSDAETARAPKDVFSDVLQANPEIPDAAARLLARGNYSSEDQAQLVRLLRPVLVRRIVDDAAEFGRQAEKRKVVVRELGSGRERVLEATATVLSTTTSRELVREKAADQLPERKRSEREALVALAEALIYPNLSFNLRATDERRQAAAASVKEVTISLRKGEIIVRDGDPVTEAHVRILEGIRDQSQTSSRARTFLGVAGLIFCALVAMWRFGQSGIQRFASAPRDAVFLLSTLVVMAAGTKLGLFIADAVATNPEFESLIPDPRVLYYLIPVASATMLVRLVQSAETAALFAMLAAPLAGLQLGGDISFALFTLVGSLVAAVGAARVTQRGTLLRAGLKLGGANVAVIIAIALLQENFWTITTPYAAAAGFAGGCLTGGLVTALAPVVENVFGYTTDVRLLELANREQPLLRDLEIRAPGTYHHSMMVGHLAEKAAEAIGANSLLAKVDGYYHDIGKMRRPHFFVENVTIHQGENRHEKLAPSMSARIIQAHVKDGLEMGRQHKLAPVIMQGIGEHHGTSIIRFFYEKAKELMDPEKGEAVAEQQYRYPGPKPQTREAGILMLADSVEAASRTLADTSHARIQQLVQRTINNYFRDGQLEECSLALRDLNAIARSFTDTLSAIRHERIDYPDATDAEGRRLDEGADEGVVERLEPRKRDRSEGTPEKREDDLKRLGLP